MLTFNSQSIFFLVEFYLKWPLVSRLHSFSNYLVLDNKVTHLFKSIYGVIISCLVFNNWTSNNKKEVGMFFWIGTWYTHNNYLESFRSKNLKLLLNILQQTHLKCKTPSLADPGTRHSVQLTSIIYTFLIIYCFWKCAIRCHI